MTTINKELIDTARELGICDLGLREMSGRNKRELVQYYLANPDWCMERGFPSLDTLRKHFFKYEDAGVFIDKEFNGELLDSKQVYVFHNCKGTIRVGLNIDCANIPMLYFGNKCRMRIMGVGDKATKNPAVVPIYQFGHNDIQAKTNKFVKFIKYKSPCS